MKKKYILPGSFGVSGLALGAVQVNRLYKLMGISPAKLSSLRSVIFSGGSFNIFYIT